MELKTFVMIAALFSILALAGCVQSAKEAVGATPTLHHIACADDNRKADYTCVDVTDPVCAWYKDGSHKQVQNFCVACKDANVVDYTEQGDMATVCPQ